MESFHDYDRNSRGEGGGGIASMFSSSLLPIPLIALAVGVSLVTLFGMSTSSVFVKLLVTLGLCGTMLVTCYEGLLARRVWEVVTIVFCVLVGLLFTFGTPEGFSSMLNVGVFAVVVICAVVSLRLSSR